ncbi:MAG: alpha/beta fold hydrolase [Lachnospiraceae bacterium]
MSYYTFNGNSIFYEEIGSGLPLLLLHGNTASSKMFSEIIPHYSPDYKVIIIDFLGHGQSERLTAFPADLWFYEAQQVIAFLEKQNYKNVRLIGSSGGALVALNVALEVPDLVNSIIADSFEGEVPLKEFTQNVVMDRASSKLDNQTRQFYRYMHGDDWESVVDNDTNAIVNHEKHIKKFFHKSLTKLKPQILMTGSKEDEFVCEISPDYFETTYRSMLKKIGHGSIHLFETGWHPAMLSNQAQFVKVSKDFFDLC